MGAAAGFALTGLSLVMEGVANAQGASYEAAKAERARQIGEVQADQVSTAYRDDLNTTIANIRAIRAATGAHPDSPSSFAYIGEQERRSERARRIEVGGIKMQARQYGEDAQFYRRSASMALLGSGLKAGAYLSTPPIGMFA